MEVALEGEGEEEEVVEEDSVSEAVAVVDSASEAVAGAPSEEASIRSGKVLAILSERFTPVSPVWVAEALALEAAEVLAPEAAEVLALEAVEVLEVVVTVDLEDLMKKRSTRNRTMENLVVSPSPVH